ncbi:cadherin domain-containing protein [Enterovibrio coralii]|uniref:Cadherin domain-containing protein n=1 Tax=Enterovibrio coralii TaxID=294935 RepID=A0A135I6Q4_9GAMM|nr:cadherin domain-containing protein [Enterovibrio coralii]KXF81119.1 hypothetical protein ATN88_19390 [Enterovibrio coralii]
MIAVSPDGELRVVNGNDVGFAGDLIIAFHDASFMASPGSTDYPGLGSRATAFVIADYGPQPVFSAIANDGLDDVMSQSFPNSGIASVIGLANSGIQISRKNDDEDDESHDETRVPLSVIEGCLNSGVAMSDMAGFDTKGIFGELSPFQLDLVGRMFPLAEIIDLDDGENIISENAMIGDEVGIRAAKEFDDGHGEVTYSLSKDAGGLFAIDPETGVVTVAGNLDYETATSYEIEVTATSEDNQTQTKTFTISLTDSSPEEGDTDNAVSSISAINGVQGEVSESITNGSSTGLTVSAIDEDGDYITYELIDDAGGTFEIDSETGEVTVADSSLLDYEIAQSQTIVVQATSTDGSSTTQTFTIDLTDDNTEFSISAVTDNDANPNVVLESAAIGTSVGVNFAASDGDLSDTISYSLSDDAGGLFQIDSTTGEVTVAAALDYETATSHNITVVATSTDGTTTNQTVTINITDDTSEFSATTVTDTDATANSVSESAANGASVGIDFHSEDGDGTDSITYTLTDDAGGLFTIDASTGEVTLNGSLDYETATDHTITVKATSTDGSSSSQNFTIQVEDDKTEFSVTAVTDTDGTANVILETAAIGSTVGVQFTASDSDLSDTVTYSLSDDAGGLFAINPTTGVVTVAAALDYETATSHDITVEAKSTDGSTTFQTVTINLTDNTSEFSATAVTDSDASANSVSESATIGSSVGVTFHSQDGDGSDSITYSLTNDAGGLFAINPSTGEVTVNGTLDYETATSHVITVLATSTDGSTSTQTLTIGLTDDTSEYAVTAVVDTDSGANTVSENAAVGSQVGVTLSASDSDATDTVTYTLIDNAGGMFAIDAKTGVVTVNGNLNYESATQHTIVVQAKSSDGSTNNQSFVIDVTNADASMGDTDNSIGAITDTDTDVDQVSDTASIGDTVGIDASAIDADGDNIVYSLSDDASGLFTINSSTGVVTIAADVSTLTDTTQTITIVATSSDGSSSTKDFDIDIIDGGIGELSDADSMQNLVGDASNGYTYLQAQAVDGDGDSVTYSLTNDYGGAFSINASTGQVYVANHSLLNASTNPQVTIEVKATSGDGTHVSKEYTIDVTSETVGSNISNITDSNGGSNSVSESAANGTAVNLTAAATPGGISNWIDNTYVAWHGHMGNTIQGLHVGGIPSGATVKFYVGNTVVHTVTTNGDYKVYGTNSSGTDNIPNGSDVWATVTYNGMTSNVAKGYHFQDPWNNYQISKSTTQDSVTYSLTDDHNGAFQINSSTGVVTVRDNSKLDFETDPNPTVTVRAVSSGGSVSIKTFGITLTDDFSAVADTYSATEEGTLTVNASSGLLSNDTGDTNNAIEIATDNSGSDASTVSAAVTLTTTLGGTVTVNPDGSFTYTAPLLDHTSSSSIEDSFYYRVGDGSWTKVALNVDDMDITANDDSDSVGELGTIYGNVISDSGGTDSAASDAKVTSVLYDGTTYFISGATTITATHGTLTINPEGSYSFVSSVSGSGPYSDELFTYTLGDDDGDSDTAVLTIAHDLSMTAVADVVSVYESSLAYGSEVGADLHYRVGNVLDNDLGITGDAEVTSVEWNGTTYNPNGSGVIVIPTDHGEFTLYTENYGVHRAGEFQFHLTTASDGSNETEVFTYNVSNSSESVSSTVTVSIVDDPIISFAGMGSDDSFTGTSADETIFGGGGADTLDGGLGNDLIVGGAGGDTLTGGSGSDTFKFLHADVEGTTGVTIDHIADFDLQSDVLDLSDLLQDESDGTLDDYLSVLDDGSGHAVISISSHGDGSVDQQIVFDNLSVSDMAAAYSIDTSGKTDGEVSSLVLVNMMLQAQLTIDH